MRKLIVLSFLTLDGVVQQDPSGGFPYGEWDGPFWDEFLDQVMLEQMSQPYDLVLGRKTYEKFAAYWPYQNTEENPLAAGLNTATKYVASTRFKSSTGRTRRSYRAMWPRRSKSSSSKTDLSSRFTAAQTSSKRCSSTIWWTNGG